MQLRAVTGAGNGPWSAPTSATPQTAPDAPTVNLITVGDGALAVSWSAPSDTGGSAITSYDARYIRSDALDKSDDRLDGAGRHLDLRRPPNTPSTV